MSLRDRVARLLAWPSSGGGGALPHGAWRSLGVMAAVAALLFGLVALDRQGGRSLAEHRIRIAAEEKARGGLRLLAKPYLDSRGRPRKTVAVRLESRGHEACRAALEKAVVRDPVFVPASDATARLRARCRVDSAGGAGMFAVVRLELRLLDGPLGEPRAKVFKARQQLVGYLALVPPLLAVILALGTGRILLSMLAAIFAAAVVSLFGRPDRLGAPVTTQLLGLPLDLVSATWWGTKTYVLEATFGQFKLQIMAFAASLVGMVAVITRAGGIQGLLGLLGRFQGSPRATRLSVALMGLVLFFDDCANTLVLGSAARPLTDAARVSREKLAYLVDSTAAPIAGIAVISTWIGFEVGLFQSTAESLGLGISGFELFFQALPLRFYCLFTIFFLLAATLLDRDFGPMLRAERRALTTGRLYLGTVESSPAQAQDASPAAQAQDATQAAPAQGAHEAAPAQGAHEVAPAQNAHEAAPAQNAHEAAYSPSWVVAALPIGLVIGGVLGGILWLGHRTPGVQLGLAEGLFAPLSLAHLRECFSYASKDDLQGWSLLGAGLAGSLLALLLATSRRIPGAGPSRARSLLNLGWTWVRGAGAIGGAIGILVGAWAIQAACESLGTQVVLTAALGGAVDPMWLPLLVFLTSAGIAFATGTSWGTMGILIPAVLPIAHALGGAEHPVLLYLSAGAVLDGAIFGDHCSPISDTTVMSSLSSGCPHMDHFRTQLPYALTVMVAAALGGYLARGAGMPLWACYGLSMAALVFVLFAVGRRPAG